MPLSEITATSVVPPPTSSTIEPLASLTGNPAPMAAAMGSSIRKTSRAPAPDADSRIARRSTWVEPHGTQTSTRGLGRKKRFSCALWMKCCNIFSVTVKSAITPSFSGRMAWMLPGVRPSMLFAALPTAAMLLPLPCRCPWRMRDYGGLVEHDARAAGVDQRIGGAEIDREIIGEQTPKTLEHERVTAEGRLPVAEDAAYNHVSALSSEAGTESRDRHRIRLIVEAPVEQAGRL